VGAFGTASVVKDHTASLPLVVPGIVPRGFGIDLPGSVLHQCVDNNLCHSYPDVCIHFYVRALEQEACAGGVFWAIRILGHNL